MIGETQHSRYGTAASRWAGVGPYYAMFPVSFAIEAVKEYTKSGDCVFDPFAGRATSLFAAASEGRFGLGIEINPVGWVYGKAKLQTAERGDVEERIRWLGHRSKNYRTAARKLPKFFQSCFCPEVQEFLLAARDSLDWRRKKADWTTMALLMIDLHGKKENSFSNQMRQTKAMSPQYAIGWWKERSLEPPERNPVEFVLKKVEWRYAKGRLDSGSGHIYLGDCQSILNRWKNRPPKMRANLLLTSPPYHGVANYFYDQWLRLWLLGGPEKPHSSGEPCKRKFENKKHYADMLCHVFAKSKSLLKRDAVVFVRTDARQFTREATIKALESAFPRKKLRSACFSLPDFSQTALFDSELESKGEIDFVMW
ncbi:MAG: site-specific DNA-methyltransferase [Deltaproteobacteria bacterium]|nr:site-specific DNA-methyltransferase [Deltaproteobacteria bacterium]